MERIRVRRPPRRRRSGGSPTRDGCRLWLAAIWMAVCPLVSISSSAQEEAEPGPRSWHAQALARGPAGLNVTYLWSLGPKFRAETVVAGHKIVTIVNGDTYYVYDAVSMTGVAIRRSPVAIANDSSGRRPFGNEAETLISQGGEKIREELLLGTPSDVYQLSDASGRRVLRETQDDYRLPLRIEIYDRATGVTKYTDFLDWLSGLRLMDAFFEPEPSIKFDHYELEEYVRLTAEGPIGVPILYAELLHGRNPEAAKAGAAGSGAAPGPNSPR